MVLFPANFWQVSRPAIKKPGGAGFPLFLWEGAFVVLEGGLRWLAVGDQRATVAVVILQGLPDFEEILVGFFIARLQGCCFDADWIQDGQGIAWRR